ncbi:MAG: hypothetical protein JOZ18_16770 [Chloroflexi bacterium]|nr:hypothetical protein [Chloroflexota bacterium]
MLCPRCGYELDATQGACQHCGFFILKSSSRDLLAEAPQIRQEGSSQGQQVSAYQTLRRNMNEASTQNTPFYFQLDEQQNKHDKSLPRATRLITGPSQQSESPRQTVAPSLSIELVTPAPSPLEADLAEGEGEFSPGSLLCRGRYRLIGKQERQQWAHGAYETHWRAQDLLQGGANVIVCEMELPDIKAIAEQASLRAAMRALSSAGRNPHVPSLLDVFRDHGRDFFVFQDIEGESLLARMQRSRQMLQEQEAIECCLQMTEVLESLAKQEPPLFHGLINPSHILMTANGQWYLTDFSIVLASGTQQYLSNLDPALLSPFTASEFIEGKIDSRSDLYALLATVYYGVTGKFPKGQVLNAPVSPSFSTIFMKGLHPIASQRYQQPSVLRQDLLALRPRGGASASTSGRTLRSNTSAPASRQRQTINTSLSTSRQEQINTPVLARRQEERNSMPVQWTSQERPPFAPTMQNSLDPLAQALPSLAVPDEMDIPAQDLLPRPEELPPMQPGNDLLAATLWMVGIVICCLIPILLK